MSDQGNHGTDWTDAEVELVVAAYFDMLALESSGQPFVKRRFAELVMDQTNRSHRSVEFKFMNVSAALEALHLKRIIGYRSMPNIQSSLTGAIERYLVVRPEMFEFAALPSRELADPSTLYIEKPPDLAATPTIRRSESLSRLVRKIDPVARDFRNRALGRAGEELVFNFERQRLSNVDRPDLAKKVRWVAQEDGDGAGYDGHSFDAAGRDRLIEVKTTRGGQRAPFLISRNECALAAEQPEEFRVYRVYQFGEAPKIFKLKPPLEHSVILRPEVYSAAFG